MKRRERSKKARARRGGIPWRRSQRRSSPSARRPSGSRGQRRPRHSGRSGSRGIRLFLVGCLGFALLVLFTSLPVSTLLSQRSQLSSTATELRGVEAENQVLRRQAAQLTKPSVVAEIARSDYGLVPSGAQAYMIVPASASSSAGSESAGHLALDGPVVAPGSAESEQLNGASDTAATEDTTSAQQQATSSSAARTSASAAREAVKARSQGFWSRVLLSLQFWR